MSALAASADVLLGELRESPAPRPPQGGGSANAIQKLSYTHQALIDLIVANPYMSQNELAARFGYTPGWLSRIIASDAFQQQLMARRDEIIDPSIKATVEERFRALVVLSLERLHEKLSAPQVSDNVALRAAELGAKALGIGGHAPPPPPPATDRLAALAERLLVLQANVRQQGASYAKESGRVLDSTPVRTVPGEILEFGPETADSRAADPVAVQSGPAEREVNATHSVTQRPGEAPSSLAARHQRAQALLRARQDGGPA